MRRITIVGRPVFPHRNAALISQKYRLLLMKGQRLHTADPKLRSLHINKKLWAHPGLRGSFMQVLYERR